MRRRAPIRFGRSEFLESRLLLSAVQIMDNGDAGHSRTGVWRGDSSGGYAGDLEYSTNAEGAATAVYSFSGLEAGQYRVSSTWVGYFNWAPNAAFTIRDGGSATLGGRAINQQQSPNDFVDQGTNWEDVGIVTITGSSLVVELSNVGTSQYVIADAIRIERIGDAPAGPEVAVQDGAAGVVSGSGSVSFGEAGLGQSVSKTFTIQNTGTSNLLLQPASAPTGFTITTNFSAGQVVAPGGSASLVVRFDAGSMGTFGGVVSFASNDADENPFQFTVTGKVTNPDVRVMDNGDAGHSRTGVWRGDSSGGHAGDLEYSTNAEGAATASWSFSGLAAGQYRVSSTWVGYWNWAPNAAYSIRAGSGGAVLASRVINQQQSPNDFVDQGTNWEDLGVVTISGSTLVVELSNVGTSQYVIADAIRVERIEVATPSGAVEPFWMKQGNTPTYAPTWYSNRGPVTKEVFYDTSKTPAENGAVLKSALQNLVAGDHVVIHGGTYSIDSYFVVQAVGTEAKPITIRGADGETAILTQATTGENVIDFDQSSYIVMDNLTLKGGSKGLRVHNVDHFMLVNSEVYGTASGAISANSGLASFLYFIDNEIHHTGGNGEGFYLGLDASTYIHDVWVIGNYIHDLNGATVRQGDGIEIKYGSYRVNVKWNFVERTRYPGIIAYGTGRPPADANIIEENVVLFSEDVGIQVGSDAIVRNNLVVTNGTAFLSKFEVTNPQHLSVVNNTFITANRGVRTFGWESSAGGLILSNNAIYSAIGAYIPNSTGIATVTGNVFVTDLARTFVNLKLDGSALDATPIAGSSLIGAAQTPYLPALDLWGRPRQTGADVGAVDYRA